MIKMNTYLKAGVLAIAANLATMGVVLADGHGDEGQIVDVLRSYETFVNEGNAEGLGALYTKDAVLLPDRFDVFEGSDAITGFYTFAFSALSLELEFQIDPDDVFVSGDVAYAVTTSSGTRLILETGQSIPEINRELWVFEQIEGEWMIARYAFNKSE